MSGWILLTGEYPPAKGGVADYTRLLARALALAGDRVEVWAPSDASLAQDVGVLARALPDRFGPRSISLLRRELANRGDTHVLVQWVPNAFGMRAMNFPFSAWLALRRGPTWVMFHEVAYAFDSKRGLKQNVLAAATSGIAGILASRADRSFVSTPAWSSRLRVLAPFAAEPIWLPVPSNIRESVEPAAIERARARLGLREGDTIIGSFGTYGPGIGPHVAKAMNALLGRSKDRVALLMGRGSREFVAKALGPQWGVRAIGTGDLSSDDLAAHLALCTALLQPYVDGVTTRRGSVMAGLALGVPIVTNDGPLSEPIWREAAAVMVSPTLDGIASEMERVLGDDGLLARLRERGSRLYRSRFSLDCTVRVLRDLRAEEEACATAS